MENLSPTFDPVSSSMAQGVPDGVSSPAITSPSIPAPPSPPRRQTVSSASEMPQKDVKAAVFSQHVASQYYVEHHRKAMELLRHQHREERSMWETERQELLLKVVELEAKITRITHLQGSDVPSIADKLANYSIGSATSSRSASAPTSILSASINRDQSLSPSTGGGHGSGGMDKLSSIPEGNERHKIVSFAARVDGVSNEDLDRELAGQAIPGELVDKDLDGVMIKATSLPISIKKVILEDSRSGSPSPLHSPSPSRPSPGNSSVPQRPVTIAIPSTQEILQLPSNKLYTHAAGHTPMARLADMSEEGTGATTPTAPVAVYVAEQEKPPLEPRPSTQDVKPLRPPHERGDSYFNVPVPQTAITEEAAEEKTQPEKCDSKGHDDAEGTENIKAEGIIDEDPALKGPLSLPHKPPQGQSEKGGDFLSKLDERLVNLSKEQNSSKRSSSLSESDNRNREGNDPPLRIKRSLNFGSAWGSGTAGRNA